MTQSAIEHVRSLMASILETRLEASGMAAADLADDLDLRDEGIVDSLGFVQLITELEVQLGGHIDLADLDSEYLTNVGALVRHIAESGLHNAERTHSISRSDHSPS